MSSSSPDPRPMLPRATVPGSSASSGRHLRELRRFHLGLSQRGPEGEARASWAEGKYSSAALRALAQTPESSSEKVALNAAEDLLAESAVDGDDRGAPKGRQRNPPWRLFLQAAREQLSPVRATFRHEVQGLATCGQAMLARQASGTRTEDAGQALGALGTRFIDPASLTEMLTPSDDGGGRAPSSREGLEQALNDLEPVVGEHRPETLLVHSEGSHFDPAVNGHKAEDVRVIEHQDPCALAGELFDRTASELARALRAVRRLRLETAGEYRSEIHDSWLEQLDWQGFSRDELHLLPQIVAILTADQAAGLCMASLSRLLLSGRPVQVFVLLPPLAELAAECPSFRFEPANFGLSHRQALVRQTSSSRPAHMLEGFTRAFAATRAALHVISVGGAEADLSLESRAHPLFSYDPEAGPGWAERFDLSPNPQPEAEWPTHELAVRRAGGGKETLRLPVTFADFVLRDSADARHFAAVPEDVADRHLVPVASYCARPPAEDIPEIPFIWALDGGSRLCRLAVSRTLSLACRDRLSFWRTLQEFGGIDSGYVRRAAREARQQAEEKATEVLARVKADAAAELERARRDAARDVVERLTTALLDVDPAPLAGTGTAWGAASLTVDSEFRGVSVDEVSATLLGLVDASALDVESEAMANGGGEQVARVTSELLLLLDQTS